jgi:hypothetical protein
MLKCKYNTWDNKILDGFYINSLDDSANEITYHIVIDKKTRKVESARDVWIDESEIIEFEKITESLDI